MVQFARFTGFTLAEIRELFHKFPDGTSAPARWQKLARRKIDEVDGLIARAQGIKKMLTAGLKCRCIDLEECGRVIRERERAVSLQPSAISLQAAAIGRRAG